MSWAALFVELLTCQTCRANAVFDAVDGGTQESYTQISFIWVQKIVNQVIDTVSVHAFIAWRICSEKTR